MAELTYTLARLIIWNADAYTREQVRNACAFVLATMGARREDISQASLLF
jgi:hypothetical protein